MLPTKKIIDFWFPDNLTNPTVDHDFWFNTRYDLEIKANYSDLVDSICMLNYRGFINDPLDKIALLIIGDQFTRNIYRDDVKMRTSNDDWTLELALSMIEADEDLNYDLNMRYFILLVLRHQKRSNLLDIVIGRIKLYILTYDEFIPSSLIKFYSHSICSYTNLSDEIQIYNNKSRYSSIIELNTNPLYSDILDQDIILIDNLSIDISISDRLFNSILDWVKAFGKNDLNIGISLSGGVDSMVLMSILYQIRCSVGSNLISNIVAIHIEHTNRKEAILERDFLIDYCRLLGIRLYVRTVHYMNRSTEYIGRNIYEDESKKLRFNLYKYAIIEENLIGICLGHHMGDITENVLTNMIKAKSIENLSMMKADDIQYDVPIFRPILEQIKDDIFAYAHKYGIPYFKNSTPSWSCRGVIRDQIIPKLKDQFGNFEPNIIKMSEQCAKMYELNLKYVINPYIDSICRFRYGIRIDYKIDLIIDIVWDRILIDYLHLNGYPMISIRSKSGFILWLKSLNCQQYELSRTHFAYVELTHRYIYLINLDEIKHLQIIADDLELLLNESKTDTLVMLPNKLKRLICKN